ncbi:MAG TPA: hypothetical protein PLN33_21025 [Hyphomonadaceae bacterium]|nr:hypothetical protein [Hyphomonadaceae bacterium]
MKFRMTCLVAIAAIGFGACAGMEGSGYADIDDDPQMAAVGASMPQPPVMQTPVMQPPSAPAKPVPPAQTGGPSQMQKPVAAPPPMTTGGPSQTPKPPQATPPVAPRAVGCSSSNVSIRTESDGGVEIKCATPPMAPPANLKCVSPEVLTWLTRNGTSSYVCMK